MRTLVIDTATAACSIALIEGEAVMASAHEVVGRGHAERLLPIIAALPEGGRADAILVDCGPGSFTGVRVGLAAARALALGWGVSVSGYSSLALLAAMGARTMPSLDRIAAVLEGGHGEVFMQSFRLSPLMPLDAAESLAPKVAVERIDMAAVGSGVARLLAVAPGLTAHDLLPEAASAHLLPPVLRTLAPSPLYCRAPDAKMPV